MSKNLVYDIHEKPPFSKLIVFAIQQLLAIMAATIAVPAIVQNGMSASAALFGAGIGTLVYQLFTKFKSPVFLGSSFAFIGSMFAAFAGATSTSLLGYFGLVLGAIFAGLVYVIIAVVVKYVGVGWINKLMPAAVIGPTVALIGLSLSGAAINDVFSYGAKETFGTASYFTMTPNAWVSLICALVTFAVVVLCSVYGKKMAKLIPFIIGVVSGYAVALIFTVIGYATENAALQIIDFAPFRALVADGVTLATFLSIPDFAFVKAIKGMADFNWAYVATVAVAYIPVAFVVFAEHIADHKNLSTIIDSDLLEEPGLHRTLLGDGVGSIAGAFFGGCPNTTYGESVGCVAITRNASVATISTTAVMAVLISFLSPFVAFLDSIPGCVMGGVCITLYGFIAVSGLKMIQKVNLEDNANLFTVSVILITGVGGMAMAIGKVFISGIACALILGIITNIVLNKFKKPVTEEKASEENEEK
ncbi:MAG: uracil-xanthine permease [Clostridia bacterium]|nr:uracil-xanthine permease [Clostridia bacterium]